MKYPEHNKLNTKELAVLDSFYCWLCSKGFEITDSGKQTKWKDLRVEFFGADPKVLESEQKLMLHSLQELNNER